MKKYICLLLTLIESSFLFFNAQAQSSIYHFEKKIYIPGSSWWDYLGIDTVHHRLFVSHGDAVNVINLKNETLETTIPDLHGVHGIAIANDLNRGFISNGEANAVTVFDLSTLKTIATIPVTGKDPDCIVYDPFSKQVFTFNGDSDNSTVINAKDLKVVGTITLGGSPEFAVSNNNGKIYNNLTDKNEIVVIDTKQRKITKHFSIAPCERPTALAIDIAHQRLFTACRKDKGVTVINAITGKVITTLPIGAGVDAARFDPATGLVFASAGDGTTTIIHENTPDEYQIVQTLKTQEGARTMELDPDTHKIYLSVAQHKEGERRSMV
ncbi:MAG: YncE family protein, partial [Chitinophagaceae bacterium]